MDLTAYLKQYPRAALAFSGGVDSAFLLWAAVESGMDIRPYFVKTPFQPDFELEDAQRLGRELGIEITVLHVHLTDLVLKNPSDRCYHCKKVLFGRLWEQARADGYGVLLDGTNASDDPGDRPGMRALAELRVLSPLRDCGLTKEGIRERSRRAGLFTWSKPAYACLATRFPTNTEITAEGLAKVERAESLLFSLGFSDFRVRLYQEAARIQVPVGQMPQLLEQRETLLREWKDQFQGVLIDLEGRP